MGWTRERGDGPGSGMAWVDSDGQSLLHSIGWCWLDLATEGRIVAGPTTGRSINTNFNRYRYLAIGGSRGPTPGPATCTVQPHSGFCLQLPTYAFRHAVGFPRPISDDKCSFSGYSPRHSSVLLYMVGAIIRYPPGTATELKGQPTATETLLSLSASQSSSTYTSFHPLCNLSPFPQRPSTTPYLQPDDGILHLLAFGRASTRSIVPIFQIYAAGTTLTHRSSSTSSSSFNDASSTSSLVSMPSVWLILQRPLLSSG